jgi:hypothetical protein
MRVSFQMIKKNLPHSMCDIMTHKSYNFTQSVLRPLHVCVFCLSQQGSTFEP